MKIKRKLEIECPFVINPNPPKFPRWPFWVGGGSIQEFGCWSKPKVNSSKTLFFLKWALVTIKREEFTWAKDKL